MQINVVYPKGSTGKIVDDINNELKKQGNESIICYGRGKTIKTKNVCMNVQKISYVIVQ